VVIVPRSQSHSSGCDGQIHRTSQVEARKHSKRGRFFAPTQLCSPIASLKCPLRGRRNHIADVSGESGVRRIRPRCSRTSCLWRSGPQATIPSARRGAIRSRRGDRGTPLARCRLILLSRLQSAGRARRMPLDEPHDSNVSCASGSPVSADANVFQTSADIAPRGILRCSSRRRRSPGSPSWSRVQFL
jgi:hypothetical protein